MLPSEMTGFRSTRAAGGFSAASVTATAAPSDSIQRDRERSPIFNEQWATQAFAMAVKLHEAGVFTWPEWAQRLAEEIQREQTTGDLDLGDTQYQYWLAILERLVAEKGLIAAGELGLRKDEWAEVARTTLHGQPIELRSAGQSR